MGSAQGRRQLRKQKLDDLAQYLKNVPPIPVTWHITAPDNVAGDLARDPSGG